MSKRFIEHTGLPSRHVEASRLPVAGWLFVEGLASYLLTIFTVVFVLLLGACSNAPVKHAATPTPVAASADIEAEYRQALEAMQASQWQVAAERLEAITARNDTLAGPWLNLGIAWSKLGDDERAEAALQQSITRNPAQPVAFNQLGILYRQAGRFADARNMYEQALAVQADYPDAHWNLGILHELYLQQPQQALEHYSRYQKLTGSDDQKLKLWIEQLKQDTDTKTMTAGVRNP